MGYNEISDRAVALDVPLNGGTLRFVSVYGLSEGFPDKKYAVPDEIFSSSLVTYAYNLVLAGDFIMTPA